MSLTCGVDTARKRIVRTLLDLTNLLFMKLYLFLQAMMVHHLFDEILQYIYTRQGTDKKRIFHNI